MKKSRTPHPSSKSRGASSKVISAEELHDRRLQKILDNSPYKYISPLGELMGAELDYLMAQARAAAEKTRAKTSSRPRKRGTKASRPKP